MSIARDFRGIGEISFEGREESVIFSSRNKSTQNGTVEFDGEW